MKIALPVLALLLTATLARSEPPPPKKQEVPPPTTIGSFEGTWYYVDPGFGIAIFVSRDKTGLLQLRYQVRTKNGTSYETDAGGFAKFIDDAGNLVEVLFTGTAVEPDRITGRYERRVHFKNKRSVREVSDFEMYRAEKGRKLVQHYPVYTVETTDAAGRKTTSSETDMYRFFRKASDEVVSFEEIPF